MRFVDFPSIRVTIKLTDGDFNFHTDLIEYHVIDIMHNPRNCNICKAENMTILFEYDKPPEGEITVDIGDQTYRRVVYQCQSCGHCENSFEHELDLYSEAYTNAVYGDLDGLLKSFERVRQLSAAESDNLGRVTYLDRAIKNYSDFNYETNILDVGAGMGIFVYEMSRLGYRCTAIDPDARNVLHISDNIGIRAIHGDYLKLELDDIFDVVTFNKVLEHVPEPSDLLEMSKYNLKNNGLLYVEVPDAEQAMKYGTDREEFFIDHFHIFSMESASRLLTDAGFTVQDQTRLHEPSGKFTLRLVASLNLNGHKIHTKIQ